MTNQAEQKIKLVSQNSISYILGGVTFLLILLRIRSVTLPHFLGFLVGWVFAVVTLQIPFHFLIKKINKHKDVSHAPALNIALAIYLVVFILSALVQNNSNSNSNPANNSTHVKEILTATPLKTQDLCASGFVVGCLIGDEDCFQKWAYGPTAEIVWFGTFDEKTGRPNCGCGDGYKAVNNKDLKLICVKIKTGGRE